MKYTTEMVISAHGTIWGLIRSSAKAKKKVFDLTMEQVAEIVYTPCTYCGELDVREWRKGKFAQINSIDRVDNTIGYTLENSVSCCKKCNMMKGRMSVEDFTEHIAKLARFLLN